MFGRPGLDRSTPIAQRDFIDPTLTAHIWQTKYWQSYPPQVEISQIPSLRTHIWQIRSGHIYPNPPQWYHRFLLWELIIGRPDLGRSTPSLSLSLCVSQITISQIPTLRAHIGQTRSWQIFHLPTKQWFHRFLLGELIFGRPGLGRSTLLSLSQMTISQIPTLRAHVWQARSWQIYPHRDFIDSYSKSSYLADQVLADLPTPT